MADARIEKQATLMPGRRAAQHKKEGPSLRIGKRIENLSDKY